MRNFNIIGVQQFLGGGVSQKSNIYCGNCLKRRAWTICRGLGKNEGGGNNLMPTIT